MFTVVRYPLYRTVGRVGNRQNLFNDEKGSIQRITSGMDMSRRSKLGFRYASAKLSVKHEFTQKFRLDFKGMYLN
jgi:hypothetical protein